MLNRILKPQLIARHSQMVLTPKVQQFGANPKTAKQKLAVKEESGSVVYKDEHIIEQARKQTQLEAKESLKYISQAFNNFEVLPDQQKEEMLPQDNAKVASNSYQKLIVDTYSSAKILNSLELGMLEETLQVFRDNLFNAPEMGRKTAPQLIANILEKQAEASPDSQCSSLLENYEGNSLQAARDIFNCMQIVLEFMDKSMKGLVSGDLSTFAVKQIQFAIETHLPKMEELQRDIQKLSESSVDKFYADNFKIDKEVYRLNEPQY